MLMTPLTFRPVLSAAGGATKTEKKETQQDNRRTTLENLVKQLPAEATAVYLMGLDLFKQRMGLLTVAMICGAVVLILVRIGLKSSIWVIATSLVSYVLWVYAIGSGPIQPVLESLHIGETTGFGTFIIFVWTTLTTIAANFGWIR